jgi:hypothetical protein
MRHRNRHALRPALEPMEHRVVPSVMGVLARQAERAAAHVRPVQHSVRQSVVSPSENNEALMRLQRQEALIYKRSLMRTPSAAPTPAEQRASEISNTLKQIGDSL